jgi:hypothetical protein
MPDKPDQKYLRVRNTSSDQIQLSDLQDGENAQENKRVETYINAGEYVDLPMDGDVLHSYEQGSIRGFVEDGKLTAAPYEGGKAEVWAAPTDSTEGHDGNPGTYNSPLATLQEAVDRLEDNVPKGITKIVRLKVIVSGVWGSDTDGGYRFKGPIFLNSPNWKFIGEENQTVEPIVYSDPLDFLGVEPTSQEDGGIPLIITNMTRDEWRDYVSDNGIDYTAGGSSGFSYDGSSLSDREVRSKDFWPVTYEDSNELRIDVNMTFKDIQFSSYGGTNAFQCGVASIFAPQDGTLPRTYGYGLTFRHCNFNAYEPDSQNNTIFDSYFKNSFTIDLVDHSGHGSEKDQVFDNCGYIGIIGTRRDQTDGSGYIFNMDNSTSNGNIGANNNQNIFDDGGIDPSASIPYMELYSDFDGNQPMVPTAVHSIAANDFENTQTFGVYGDTSLSSRYYRGEDDTRKYIHQVWSRGPIELDSNFLTAVSEMTGDSIDKTGTGDMILQEARTETGGITISAGTTNEIYGGSSQGTVTLNGGCQFDLRGMTIEDDVVLEGSSTGFLKGLTIKGDLIIRDSGTQVDAEGCHVQGAVQLESTVDTTQNFYGGSIIGSGHTNKIRNENGNDVSGSADWNRVGGGGGGSSLTSTEESILDAFTHGTQKVEVPLNTGSEPSDGFTLTSWNNDLAALNYDYEDGGTSPSSENDNGRWYISTATPAGYTGGDVIVRCHYSLISSGSVGDATEFRLDFGQHSQGADLTSLDPGYTDSYNNVIDLENVSYDTIQTFDFTIPESVWDPTESQTFFNLERLLYKSGSDNPNDTFQEAVYVHAFYILFNGYGLKPNPSSP